MLQLLAFTTLLSFSNTAHAAPEFKCDSYNSPMLEKNVRFCTQRSRPASKQKAGEPVVYVMHGVFGNALGWVGGGYAEALDLLGANEKVPPFTIVSFDTSGTSFFSDVGTEHAGTASYETWFITEFIPYIESTRNLCRERSCRSLVGISMGGYGALKTGLKYPDLFHAVAARSPALIDMNPYDSLKSWKEYFARHPISVAHGMALLFRARSIFTSREYFERNNPFKLVREIPAEKIPELYIDVGGRDFYGFQEGFFKFMRELAERGKKVTSTYLDAGSHDMDMERRWAVLDFVSKNLISSQ
ncbi:MAG: alpha/beta hydrolase-fold protein [Bdellovibrionia bacterium]